MSTKRLKIRISDKANGKNLSEVKGISQKCRTDVMRIIDILKSPEKYRNMMFRSSVLLTGGRDN